MHCPDATIERRDHLPSRRLRPAVHAYELPLAWNGRQAVPGMDVRRKAACGGTRSERRPGATSGNDDGDCRQPAATNCNQLHHLAATRRVRSAGPTRALANRSIRSGIRKDSRRLVSYARRRRMQRLRRRDSHGRSTEWHRSASIKASGPPEGERSERVGPEVSCSNGLPTARLACVIVRPRMHQWSARPEERGVPRAGRPE